MQEPGKSHGHLSNWTATHWASSLLANRSKGKVVQRSCKLDDCTLDPYYTSAIPYIVVVVPYPMLANHSIIIHMVKIEPANSIKQNAHTQIKTMRKQRSSLASAKLHPFQCCLQETIKKGT